MLRTSPEARLQHWLLFLAGFCFLFFLLTLYQRVITGDDAWFAEQAYWFAKDGYVHTELFEGYPLYDGQHLVYHKLHIWQGALVYRLFGWNAYVFKAIPLVYILIFLLACRHFIRHTTPPDNQFSICLAFLFLFFANNLVLQHGFEFRPDIMMMCTGFLSYLFLYHAQRTGGQYLALLSGVMGGITALFHLNGLIFIAAGGLLLILNRNWRFIFFFAAGSILAFLPYFYEINSIDKYHEFMTELTQSPAVSEEDRNLWGWIKKLVFEFTRYTHHTYEAFYLLMFLLIVIPAWQYIKQDTVGRQLLIYFLLLTAFNALLTVGGKTAYLLYTLPFQLLIIVRYGRLILQNSKIKYWFLVTVFLYALTNLGHGYGIFQKRQANPAAMHAEIVNKYQITPGDSILAPIEFIFNEIGRLHIQTFLPYILRFNHDFNQITLQNVFEDIYARHKTYAILNPAMRKDLKFSPESGKIYFGYQYVGQEGTLAVFKRVSPNQTR